jgi:WXXGXW repeat (2 copies)
MPGHYIERPKPDANWLPGYWQQEADGWAWVEGRWRS